MTSSEEKLKYRWLQVKYNRLFDLLQKQNQCIIENPFPALHLAYDRVVEVESKLKAIQGAFACDSAMIDDNSPIEYESIESVLMRRHNKIKEILNN